MKSKSTRPDSARHFAFFDATTGAYRREAIGVVPPPLRVWRWLPASLRAFVRLVHTSVVSGVARDEIGLDVTDAGYPLGDFQWAHFDVDTRTLRWPQTHRFVVVDRGSLVVAGHTEAARPVRSSDAHVVVDITETALEPYLYDLHGRFVLSARGGVCFLSHAGRLDVDALVSVAAPRLLTSRVVAP